MVEIDKQMFMRENWSNSHTARSARLIGDGRQKDPTLRTEIKLSDNLEKRDFNINKCRFFCPPSLLCTD